MASATFPHFFFPQKFRERVLVSDPFFFSIFLSPSLSFTYRSFHQQVVVGTGGFGHGFHETKQGVRYTISEPARREVLALLLKLNHERYEKEIRQGLHDKKKGRGKKAKPDEGSGMFE